jgi:hypothetical protein
MPPSNRYSNAPTGTNSSDYIVRTSVRTTRPYVSSSGFSNLTYKERLARMQVKTAGVGVDMGMSGGGNTMQSQQGNFFSPQLSPDFLELPQSRRERLELYRHYYNSDEMVAQAIDLHTELPLSKVRLSSPKPRTCPKGFKSPENYGKYILSRFELMSKRIKLFQRLITMVHHYWLDGSICVFAEDGVVDVPEDVGHDIQVVKQAVLREDGSAEEVRQVIRTAKDTKEEEELAYYAKHYKGWERLVVIPVDRVKLSTFSFTDKVRIELIPSSQDRSLIERAKGGDPIAEEMVAEMPAEVREHIEHGNFIPMGTDPDEGSFAYMLSGRKGADSELGQSILDRCLRTLTFREKLRQAQTMIASRAMTPKRIVWAEGLSDSDVEALREQVDLALVDPDYSIVTNYEVHWEEMGSRDRLLDLSAEYEQTERRLITGLGVTESLMSGESLFSGDRLKLAVINERYLYLREVIQEYVEENLFKPVARRMGFIEEDEWGQEVVLYPKLSFTRMPLRDSQETFEALMTLYQKGSVSVDLILEILNIDPHDTRLKIEEDLLSVNDSAFNEVQRSAYSEVGRELVAQTDIVERIAKYMHLKVKPPAEGEGDSRFG